MKVGVFVFAINCMCAVGWGGVGLARCGGMGWGFARWGGVGWQPPPRSYGLIHPPTHRTRAAPFRTTVTTLFGAPVPGCGPRSQRASRARARPRCPARCRRRRCWPGSLFAPARCSSRASDSSWSGRRTEEGGLWARAATPGLPRASRARARRRCRAPCRRRRCSPGSAPAPALVGGGGAGRGGHGGLIGNSRALRLFAPVSLTHLCSWPWSARLW